MPLTSEGREVLGKFEREYGKVKGKSVFYAYMKVHPKRAEKWHRKVAHGVKKALRG